MIKREDFGKLNGEKVYLFKMDNKNGCGCEKHIKDVKCDVMNCVYHDGDCYCTANQIAIGPSHATSSTDTICSTFKQNQNKA